MTRRRTARRDVRRSLSAAVLAATALVGCVDYSALSYKQDDRLTFRTPRDRATLSLPIHLDWEIEDFDVVGPGVGAPSKRAGYFAIFVDRAPVKPGRPLSDVAKEDDTCRKTPGCPDLDYYGDRQVYVTAQTEFTLRRVLPHQDDVDERDHEVTVILLDTSGRRIGESSWYREFTLRKVSR